MHLNLSGFVTLETDLTEIVGLENDCLSSFLSVALRQVVMRSSYFLPS